MAGGSTKAIKNRIKSVENTQQITKAMELVAASKLRRAKENAEAAAPFYQILKEAIGDVIQSADYLDSAYIRKQKDTTPEDQKRVCYVVIAGDRGLAGGYNNNLFKMVRDLIHEGQDVIIPVGKKAAEAYSRHHVEILSEEYDVVQSLGVADALDMSKLICEAFQKKKFDEVYLVYTKFINLLSQKPVMEQLLPLEKEDFTGSPNPKAVKTITIYDSDEEEMLNQIIPQYLSGAIYTAFKMSFASECASRRTAMNSANKNAGEMIADLTLSYNRARQSAITQEITEIISGSEAL